MSLTKQTIRAWAAWEDSHLVLYEALHWHSFLSLWTSLHIEEGMRVAVEDAAALLARGAAARRVGETAMNRESSRSHSVFTLTLETRTAGAAGLDKLLHARLNLVDLAGALMLGFRVFLVFTLTLETRTSGAADLDKLLHARLNLVELAGALIVGFGIEPKPLAKT